MEYHKLHRGRDESVLYLDFDGVLHHEDCWWHPRRGPYLRAGPEFTLFQHAPLLEELLSPYPNVKVILSTSWVRRYGVTHTAKQLPPGLRARVIAATFHTRMNEAAFAEKPRGVQVLEDVARRRPANWLALDDDSNGWAEGAERHLVLTHPERGISEAGVLSALRVALQKNFREGR